MSLRDEKSFEPDTALAAAFVPSPNFEARRGGREVDMVVLHYTGMEEADAALDWLTDPASRVSAHYLIDEAGRITQMVAERKRAWHAGVSAWAGETDINSCSIGIEIHNPGHELGYPDFPEAQMQAVEALLLDIIARHDIAPERILAHSDVAPGRKADPGEKFDWARLHRAGVGHWVTPEPVGEDEGIGLAARGEDVETLQRMLARYGYGITVGEYYCRTTAQVVRAFQRHFLPERVDGRACRATIATLERLLDALE